MFIVYFHVTTSTNINLGIWKGLLHNQPLVHFSLVFFFLSSSKSSHFFHVAFDLTE